MILSKLSRAFPNRFVGFRAFSRSYRKTLEKHPVLVQAFQAGVLMGAGDVLAQTVAEKQKLAQLDYMRTLKFFAIGFFVAGPGLRKWYGMLDKHATAKTPFGRTLQKVFIDQVVFAPFFLAVLLTMIGYSQHQDVEKVKAKLQNEYVDIVKANYSVWPMVQIINFRFVPLNYQVLLTQAVAVLWNGFVSWRTNLNERQQHATMTSNTKSNNTNTSAITAA